MPLRKNKPPDAGSRSGTSSTPVDQPGLPARSSLNPSPAPEGSAYAESARPLPESIAARYAESGDSELLQRRIDACYSRLAQDPSDLEVRITLSWYLLFQSLCARRQQEIWAQLLGRAGTLDSALVSTLQKIRNEIAMPVQDPRLLLRDSLKQASTVMQLSVQARERNEAARIREFVLQLGASQVVSETDAEASRILARMTRAIRGGHEEGFDD